VIDKLDTPILVELFTRITQFLKTKAFLDILTLFHTDFLYSIFALFQLCVHFFFFFFFDPTLHTMFPWLWQGINLSNIPLDPPLLSSLMVALEDISVDPSKNGIEAAQILAQLKKLGLVWGQ
jgi:hypothetical protein